MGRSSNAHASPAASEADRKAKLEFEHKTVLDTGKFFYDGLFKLAPMSFALNGVLLAALGFVAKDAGSASKDFLSIAIIIIGLIGVVYNLGAGCACISLAITVWRLTGRFGYLDKQLGLEIAINKSSGANFWGSVTWFLTLVFFLLWIALWTFLIMNRTILLNPAGPSGGSIGALVVLFG
jgi:hypothetical protein